MSAGLQLLHNDLRDRAFPGVLLLGASIPSWDRRRHGSASLNASGSLGSW